MITVYSRLVLEHFYIVSSSFISEISLNGNVDIKLQVAHYKVTTAIWRVTLGPIMPAGGLYTSWVTSPSFPENLCLGIV